MVFDNEAPVLVSRADAACHVSSPPGSALFGVHRSRGSRPTALQSEGDGSQTLRLVRLRTQQETGQSLQQPTVTHKLPVAVCSSSLKAPLIFHPPSCQMLAFPALRAKEK